MTSAVLQEALCAQPRVRAFFERSLAHGRVSHAFLFSGASSQARLEAARALAQALLCPKGGCGICDECRRVEHTTHPDLTWLTPGSSTQGYLVEQIRGVIQDSALSPVRAQKKLYVVSDAARLGTQAANALLKTLEEPNDDVVFILEAPTASAVLATVRSRCTVVPFAPQDPRQEARRLAELNRCDEALARVALVVGGPGGNAASYLSNGVHLALRERALGVLSALATLGDGELLTQATELIHLVQRSVEEEGEQEDNDLAKDAEYLSKSALKEREQRHKRRLQQKQRALLLEVARVIQTALQDALSERMGAQQAPLNAAYPSLIAQLAAQAPRSLLVALDQAREAEQDLLRGLTPELVLQVFFLRLKETLCPTSAQ